MIKDGKNDKSLVGNSHSAITRATYIFSLQRYVSRRNLMALTGQSQDQKVADEINHHLAVWIKRGLIIEEVRNDHDERLSVYHSSYRRYLREKLDWSHPTEFYVPLATNITREFNLAGDLHELEVESPQACSGWVKLLLDVFVQADNTKALQTILQNFAFGELACRSRDGLGLIIEKLRHVSIKNINHERAYERVLKAGAVSITKWVKDGRLKDSTGKDYTYTQLLDMAHRNNQSNAERDKLSLSQFLLALENF